jgi:hypothetical protein
MRSRLYRSAGTEDVGEVERFSAVLVRSIRHVFSVARHSLGWKTIRHLSTDSFDTPECEVAAAYPYRSMSESTHPPPAAPSMTRSSGM